MRHLNARMFVLAVTLCTPTSFAVAQECGKTEAVAQGETLEQLAARCKTTAEAILSANPSLAPSEIQAGLQLDMPADADGDWLGRARDAVRDAGERVNQAAEAAGRSVSDYLSDQPDLNRDILEFGERLGLPGVSTKESRGADVTVATRSAGPGEEVTLNASGLPGGAEVVIGVRIGNEAPFRTVSRAQTSRAGTLQVTVPVPEQAQKGQEIGFAVETANGRVRVVSEPFSVGARR